MHAVASDLFDWGHIGFGASSASVEFSEMKILKKDSVIVFDINECVYKEGDWNIHSESGSLSTFKGKQYLLKSKYGDDYIFECKVRKNGGEQGFQFFLGMSEDGQTGFRYNVGMWSSNDRAELVRLDNGKERGILVEHSGKRIETGKWYNVKIVVSPMLSEFYLDGKLILSYIPQPLALQFIASGYDQTLGDVIIKVVNADSTTYSTTIRLDGAAQVLETGKVISLTAVNGSEENTWKEPKKIYPQESEYKRFGKKFDYDFPPFSYTILRIKAR